ncbi:hypothetical protein HDU87_004231 [Geranomyces variabilis]|uniref:Uncharacterized protein n=1 Tax=Geranomyces variabilis TaxID=109894 RepID=A0AAD5TIP4_9FUNG|nr:hypothetical protein HDU87_004231 [Geranomyces variabilis]
MSYDIELHPELYFESYAKLAMIFDAAKRRGYYGVKLFNAVPLRTHYYQSYVTIDTITLAKTVLGHGRLPKTSNRQAKMHIWRQCFDLTHPSFHPRGKKPSYTHEFQGSIETDGFGVSAQVKRKLARTYVDHPKNLEHIRACFAPASRRNIILIDPNKRDMLFMMEMAKPPLDGGPFVARGATMPRTMRYTSNNRRFDTQSRARQLHAQQLRDTTTIPMPPGHYGPPTPISVIEATMPSRKTARLAEFNVWLQAQAEWAPDLIGFYSDPIWRDMKFTGVRRRQRSEDNLIKRMREKFGHKLLVIMGDWGAASAGRHMRFHAPSKVAGFRKLFQKHHIPCYLLDEFCTSSFCPDCHSKLKKNVLPRRLSPRPWRARQGQMDQVHGLLGCKGCADPQWPANPKYLCPLRYWNRDLASVKNFNNIIRHMLDFGGARPIHLSRS